MKTFEQVVDSAFKPAKPALSSLRDLCFVVYSTKNLVWGCGFRTKMKVYWLDDKSKNQWVDYKDKVLQNKYEISKAFAKPFYGKDVQQPVINICKKMLENPEAFEENPTSFLLGLPIRYDYTTVTDKDTGFSLEIKQPKTNIIIGEPYYSEVYLKTEVSYPDYFSIDESKLLVETFRVWKKHMDKINKETSENSYKEYQEQERQKLMVMYTEQSDE